MNTWKLRASGSQMFVIRSPFMWNIFSSPFSLPPVKLRCIHSSSPSPFYFASPPRSSWAPILPVISFLFLFLVSIFTPGRFFILILFSDSLLAIFLTRFIHSDQTQYCPYNKAACSQIVINVLYIYIYIIRPTTAQY